MTLPSTKGALSGPSGELVSMKYVEVVVATSVARLAQCGGPRRRRTWELNQPRCPFRLAILEAHNESLTPEPVATLTAPTRGLTNAGAHAACGGVAVARA